MAVTTNAASSSSAAAADHHPAASSSSMPTTLTSYLHVRPWLQQHYRKQLATLDRFLLELQSGRLASPAGYTTSSSSNSSTHHHQQQQYDRRIVTHRTVDLIRQLAGSTRWKSPAEILSLLRGVGCLLQAAGGNREPAIGNVIRRIMAAVREEATSSTPRTTSNTSTTVNNNNTINSVNTTNNNNNNTSSADNTASTARLSLQSMLWAAPQHVKLSRVSTVTRTGDHQRQESFAETTDMEADYPAAYYLERPDLKSAMMEAIDEIMNELEDLHKNINEQVVNHINSGEIILTSGRSKTVESFLKAAALKKRHLHQEPFQVIVCEGAPFQTGHAMASALRAVGIETTLIHDSAVWAVMARVNKVILPAHAVLANGGLVTSCGGNLVALAAKQNAVPVICTTGLFKLCPQFPHEGQDTLNHLVSPAYIMDYASVNTARYHDQVEFVNPVHDLIKPEHIDLYITNAGSFQPSFIYRLLAEYYHTDDWTCFD